MSALPSGADGLHQLLDNGVLAWALAACGLAQLGKLLVELVEHGRWRPAVLLETGGMPSSHSALVTGAAAGIGWELGFDDPLFAFACTIAFVVMYDASGVRRAAGLQARRLNSLPKQLWQAGATAPADTPPQPPPQPLKESLGHTRLEVLAGSLIGPAVALCGLALAGSPLQIAQGWGWLPAA
ncbi:divergent PAP2 family protein [Synechococcus sp. Tobar12-5m-g]|uniref:divergent PAP2 family protein n=1 Tax=unclassified Synechococcus TaxID=2626047 RepID=UPI0020CEC71D|nr:MULTISPECIES: divergent PAP2 family protein [unclassified Synechococcus]MCP9772918.1 divergent PAP2 family protein [Synechococcus sp. Tobar12-5m-g]MCP9873769.1 divergent PAP2 family protein [Synechococcus sp. Cruz CV-v-12]